jgi:PAS domain S-box-containing protein
LNLLFALMTMLGTSGAEAKRVLVLHSFGNAAPPFTTHSVAFETELTDKMGEFVDLDEVYLDVARYATLEIEEALVEFMRKRQAKWSPDLVVPIGSPAGVFVARYRDQLFPSTTPIIYTGMDKRRLPEGALEQNASFVGESFDFTSVVEDILRLAPKTTNISVVIGASPLETYWADALRKEYQGFTNRVNFTWFSNLSFDQMLERAANTPPHSFILLVLLMRDANGVTHNADEALKRLHAVANAPINSLFQHQLGLGIVGGRLYQAELEGIESARIAIRVLHGENITNFPPKIIPPYVPSYDSRELQRWKISEDRLPPGSRVLFRELTAWDRYKGRIVAILSLCVGEGALIFLLMANLIRRRRAERSVAEIEARFRSAADVSPVMIWMTGTNKLCTFVNKAWLDFTGRKLEQELGNGWTEGLHPEDVAASVQAYYKAFEAREPFSMEYRLRKRSGDYAWVIDNGAPRFDPNGAFLGYIGAATDVTAPRQAEARLRESENRMTMAAEAAHLGMWVWNESDPHIWTSANWKTIHGYPCDADIGFDSMLERIHPDDRAMVARAVSGAFANRTSFFVEHRVRLPDGQVRWISMRGRVEQGTGEESMRLLGISIDITERKEAENAAREVTGKLITAQEDERRRLARDLHDDLNQRLALLSIDADLLERIDHNSEAGPIISDIASQLKNLSSEVHKLSYQLHPAKLEQLGLVSATRALCQEQSKLGTANIEFNHEQIPRELNRTAALCIYRIVQEGLQNMRKHSSATQAQVELKRELTQISLRISDNGHGFDMAKTSHHAGLGLVGMRERVRLVNGHITFQSEPGRGTRIEVKIPIEPNSAPEGV